MPIIQSGGIGKPSITLNVPPGGKGPGTFNNIKGYWDNGNFRADGPPGGLAKTRIPQPGPNGLGVGAGLAGLGSIANAKIPGAVGVGLGLLGLSAIIALMENKKKDFYQWYDGNTGGYLSQRGLLPGQENNGGQNAVISVQTNAVYNGTQYTIRISGQYWTYYAPTPLIPFSTDKTHIGDIASYSVTYVEDKSLSSWYWPLYKWIVRVTRSNGSIVDYDSGYYVAGMGNIDTKAPSLKRCNQPSVQILSATGTPIPPPTQLINTVNYNINNSSSSTTIINHPSRPQPKATQAIGAAGQVGAVAATSTGRNNAGGYVSQSGVAQPGTPPPPFATPEPWTPTPITLGSPKPPPGPKPETIFKPETPNWNEKGEWTDAAGGRWQKATTTTTNGGRKVTTTTITKDGEIRKQTTRTDMGGGKFTEQVIENGRIIEQRNIQENKNKSVTVDTIQNGIITNQTTYKAGTPEALEYSNPTPTVNPTPTPATKVIVNGVAQNQTTTSTSTQGQNTQTSQIINQQPITVNANTTPVNLDPILQLSQQIKNNQENSIIPALSDVATIGVLTPFILGQTELINTNTNNKIAAIPVPTPCAYPAYHPSTVAERSAISGKVDLANTTLGVVSNTQLSVIDSKLGPQVNGGLSGWLGRFSRSLYLDRIYNGMSLMLQIHNAAMLSRNLAESISTLIEAGMNALNLKNEDDEAINIPEMIGSTVTNWIKAVVGEEVFNGVSAAWKKLSAIYTAAVNIYELMLNSLAGIAEGLETMGRYTGKIGNALKKGGVILENAYEWMDENVKVKTGRFSAVEKVTQGLSDLTDVTDNLTQVAETVSETTENVTQIQSEFSTIKEATAEAETAKDTAETAAKTVSQSGAIAKSDLNPPES